MDSGYTSASIVTTTTSKLGEQSILKGRIKLSYNFTLIPLNEF
jgi:hypothetical protein